MVTVDQGTPLPIPMSKEDSSEPPKLPSNGRVILGDELDGSIRGFIASMANSEQESIDIYELFSTNLILKIFRSSSDPIDDLKPYAFAVARNTAMEYFRKRNRKREVNLDSDYVAEEPPDQIFPPELFPVIKKLMGTMSRARQDVIHQCFWMDKRSADVAAERGVSDAAVSQMRFRVFKDLFELLEPYLRKYDPDLAKFYYDDHSDE